MVARYARRNRNRGKQQNQNGNQNTRGSRQAKKRVTDIEAKDLQFRLGGPANMTTFTRAMEYIRHSVVKSENEFHEDIETALKTMRDVTIPKARRGVNELTIVADNEMSRKAYESRERELDIDYAEARKEEGKRRKAYASNKKDAALLMYRKCSIEVQTKLKELPNWEDMEYDPFQIYHELQKLCTNHQDNQYEPSRVLTTFKNFFTMKQRPEEPLNEYVERMRQGLRMLQETCELRIDALINMKEYDTLSDSRKKDESRRAMQTVAALMTIEGALPEYYGPLQRDMQAEYARNPVTNNYPQDVDGAYNALKAYRDANAEGFKQIAKQKRSKKAKQDEKKDDKAEGDRAGQAFAQGNAVICHVCGKPGEKAFQCQMKKSIPEDQWYKNTNTEWYKKPPRSAAFVQEAPVAEAITEEKLDEVRGAIRESLTEAQYEVAKKHGLCQVHISMSQDEESSLDLMWSVLLDNQSTHSIYANPALVKNIRKAEHPLMLQTNGGVLVVTQEAELPGYGKVWFDERAITNILCFNDVRRSHGIYYNPGYDKFIIAKPILGKDRVEFKAHNRHYVLRLKKPQGSQFPQTVLENETYYTPRQVERAKQAREFLYASGTPSLRDLKALIMSNAVKNNPVTIQDVKIAEALYGKDIGVLKGKTTRSKPAPVISDMVEIPRLLVKRNRRVELCLDVVTICGLPFLSTISKGIMYRTLNSLPNLRKETYYKTIDKVLRLYNRAGFKVKTIYCDRAFRPLLEPIEDELDCRLNYVSRDEHVPEAERNNRTIKERTRAVYHHLPYANIPKVMCQEGFEDVVLRINWVPPKGGVSQQFSPFTIIHQRAVDYNKHCKYTFGDYVQTHEEGDNTMRERTIDAPIPEPTDRTSDYKAPSNRHAHYRTRYTPSRTISQEGQDPSI
jgi:hypothetical protein